MSHIIFAGATWTDVLYGFDTSIVTFREILLWNTVSFQFYVVKFSHIVSVKFWSVSVPGQSRVFSYYFDAAKIIYKHQSFRSRKCVYTPCVRPCMHACVPVYLVLCMAYLHFIVTFPCQWHQGSVHESSPNGFCFSAMLQLFAPYAPGWISGQARALCSRLNIWTGSGYGTQYGPSRWVHSTPDTVTVIPAATRTIHVTQAESIWDSNKTALDGVECQVPAAWTLYGFSLWKSQFRSAVSAGPRSRSRSRWFYFNNHKAAAWFGN
jgi:hypothetical protein